MMDGRVARCIVTAMLVIGTGVGAEGVRGGGFKSGEKVVIPGGDGSKTLCTVGEKLGVWMAAPNSETGSGWATCDVPFPAGRASIGGAGLDCPSGWIPTRPEGCH